MIAGDELVQPVRRPALEEQDEPVDEDDRSRPPARSGTPRCSAGSPGSKRKKTVSRERRRSSVTTIRTGWGGRALRACEHTPLPRRARRASPAERAEHQEEGDEADDDVRDRGRDVHADAEAEEQRPGDPGPGAVEDVDEQALLGADTARREREAGSRGSARRGRAARCAGVAGTRNASGRSRPRRGGRPRRALPARRPRVTKR